MSIRAQKKFIRKFFPRESDSFVHYILWERTALPFCNWKHAQWQITKMVCAMTLWPGYKFCDLCPNPLLNGEKWICDRCQATLDKE